MDFYLPDLNTTIEYDGRQHFFIYKRYASTIEQLEKNQNHDRTKMNYCLQNGIKHIRISYEYRDNVNDVLEASLKNNNELVLNSKSNLYVYLTDIGGK